MSPPNSLVEVLTLKVAVFGGRALEGKVKRQGVGGYLKQQKFFLSCFWTQKSKIRCWQSQTPSEGSGDKVYIASFQLLWLRTVFVVLWLAAVPIPPLPLSSLLASASISVSR